MILTTTPSVEGKSIKKYLGIVTGTAVMLEDDEPAEMYDELPNL